LEGDRLEGSDEVEDFFVLFLVGSWEEIVSLALVAPRSKQEIKLVFEYHLIPSDRTTIHIKALAGRHQRMRLFCPDRLQKLQKKVFAAEAFGKMEQGGMMTLFFIIGHGGEVAHGGVLCIEMRHCIALLLGGGLWGVGVFGDVR